MPKAVSQSRILDALQNTPEIELKLTELELRKITLEDTVQSNKKQEELDVVLQSMKEKDYYDLTPMAMQRHIPELYQIIVTDRVEFMAKELEDASLGKNTSFALVCVCVF